MRKPNAEKYHNPDPGYVREIVEATGLSLPILARQIGAGTTGTTISNWYKEKSSPSYRPIPYTAQYAIECLKATD